MSDERIMTVCRTIWQSRPDLHGDCGKYLRAVAEGLGYAVPDYRANGIVAWLDDRKRNRWVKVPDGKVARELAQKGVFVIAGLHNTSGHGHVAVVVDGEFYRKVYPKVWAGGLNPHGRSHTDDKDAERKKLKSVGEVWPTTGSQRREFVQYYASPGSETLLPKLLAFLKIDGIAGESTDAAHKDWMEILAYKMGIRQAAVARASAGGATKGKASFETLSVVKEIDKASSLLKLACADGRIMKEVVLEIYRKAGGATEKHHEYKMKNCIIRECLVEYPDSDSLSSLPIERVSFSFGNIQLAYYQQDRATGRPMGLIAAGWDLERNTRC